MFFSSAECLFCLSLVKPAFQEGSLEHGLLLVSHSSYCPQFTSLAYYRSPAHLPTCDDYDFLLSTLFFALQLPHDSLDLSVPIWVRSIVYPDSNIVVAGTAYHEVSQAPQPLHFTSSRSLPVPC